MSNNPIQFQRGMTLATLHKHYGTVGKCQRALFQLQWPLGFICPLCSAQRYSHNKLPYRYPCLACHHQATVTVRT